ncbi:von Willebrand factor type A domain protein [Pirellulimonas nuda]|uniref:von Willebrand factor type A domain protein n=1 Tax=Pirellulimonas nuda TaxID=2528009 RepID=A0A518DGP0_9BACT|nr:VWA domain-containing protein [Pirellulimonas nuda]QDU90602.1 von Willebrand factor type A domain protein [Pirellulimonas nuda]
MLDYGLALDASPAMQGLLLAALVGFVGVVVWLARQSYSGLGTWRGGLAVLLRCLVGLLILLALADTQLRKKSDRLTVIYLLDQSLSIPEEQRAAMVAFVNASIREQRKPEKEDRAGVIVFGRDAEVELPPVDFNYELTGVESELDRRHTNLAGAMQRAMSLFPGDAARRVVIVTDGNENVGSALREARAMADAGVSIDVLPVPLERHSEITVDKVALPADVRRGQPFELRVVVDNDSEPGSSPVAGTLKIVRKAGDRETTLSDQPVELAPGKNVYTIRETIEQSDFYTYEGRFTPGDRSSDGSLQNNVATAFTHVRGRGQVLLIEDWENPGEFDYLVERLRSEGLEITVQRSDRLFATLAELQRYDSVILANVPRSGGFGGAGPINTESITAFSDAQIEMLVRNTEEFGCGLVMLGGDRSFGAGGWTDTAIEKAMPVDFRIKSAKVTPVGALAMIMHASEIAKGNYWQKVIAAEAVKALGPKDYAGLLQWNGTDTWLWANTQGGMVQVGAERSRMLRLIDRLTVGDMPDFDPGMQKTVGAFAKLTNPTPSIKHCIIISDGDPAPPSGNTVQAFIKQGVKITTVEVGGHGTAGRQGFGNTMQDLANKTGGKYYVVRNANALPRIYQQEARRVAQPLVKELSPPVVPLLVGRSEMIAGVSEPYPPISGFVMTTVKESSLVDVLLRSPVPPSPDNSVLLASWTFGVGKSVAFTTDAGKRWANQWTGWDDYDRFFSQMVRWSMRPTGDTGNFAVATETVDGKTRVVIDAVGKDDEFINVQAMTGAAVGPDLKSIPLVIEQVAPGRYVGAFDSPDPGSYMLMISPGAGQAMIRTGVNVGYSDEFRAREANTPLLEAMAALPPTGAEPGKVIGAEANAQLTGAEKLAPGLLEVNAYRRTMKPAVAGQDIWPLLVLAASLLFMGDVFVRRVQVSTAWLGPLRQKFAERVLGRPADAPAPATVSRLQSRKRELREGEASRRFELDEAPQPTGSPLADLERGVKPRVAPTPTRKSEPTETKQEESYMDRLKKAKRDARNE